MNKILQATSRGQVTLPKGWRDKFDTNYYIVQIESDKLIFQPLSKKSTLKDKVEASWKEYKQGNVVSNEDLIKKYGL